MKPRFARIPGGAALLAAFLFAAGCSSFRTDMGRPLDGSVSSYTNRQTRVETVVRDLGPPNEASKLPDGFAFLYEYSRIKEFQLGFSVNVSFLRYFKFLHAWNGLEEQALLVTFDGQGVLQSASLGKWKENLGGGSAVQFIVNVMSLSDVARLLRPADANVWGERLLQPLPTALNASQSLGTGEHGLQQRPAMEYAGQETLEMARPKTEGAKKKIKRNYQQPQPFSR